MDTINGKEIIDTRCDLCIQYYLTTGTHRASEINLNSGIVKCIHPHLDKLEEDAKNKNILINKLAASLINAYGDLYYNKWTLGSYDAALKKARKRFQSEFNI